MTRLELSLHLDRSAGYSAHRLLNDSSLPGKLASSLEQITQEVLNSEAGGALMGFAVDSRRMRAVLGTQSGFQIYSTC